MYKICVFLFFLQMAVARPQGGVNIPPETTTTGSTTKNDVELITDGTTETSLQTDTTSHYDGTTESVNDENTTTTQESSGSQGSTTETTEYYEVNEEFIDIIVWEPLLPPLFKK